MTPGQIARRILGSHFSIAGALYRRVFVNMSKVAEVVARQIPRNARILDVGGGDGYVVNLILKRRPDVEVTMTDIASDIGGFVEPQCRARLTLKPATDVGEIHGRFDVMTLADVVHHVPKSEREVFFASLGEVALRTGCNAIIIKDVEPGNFRATLSLWSDHYITGDKGVSLVSADEIFIPGFSTSEVLMPDFPNYCVTFVPENSA